MTRFIAAVLLCAASSVGCSTMNGLGRGGGMPAHMTVSNSAPRPTIQRASYNRPAMGVSDMQCGCGEGCGTGMCGCCNGVVDDCVGRVLDCPGGCHGGGCYGGGCYDGGCYGGGCQGGPCGACGPCTCNGTGQCPCCQCMRTMVGGPYAGGTDAIYNFNPGPSSAQTAYPYYTTRGPRDFFLDKPASIGPY